MTRLIHSNSEALSKRQSTPVASASSNSIAELQLSRGAILKAIADLEIDLATLKPPAVGDYQHEDESDGSSSFDKSAYADALADFNRDTGLLENRLRLAKAQLARIDSDIDRAKSRNAEANPDTSSLDQIPDSGFEGSQPRWHDNVWRQGLAPQNHGLDSQRFDEAGFVDDPGEIAARWGSAAEEPSMPAPLARHAEEGTFVAEGPLYITDVGHSGEISGHDVIQGRISNCYFAAAMSAVAHSNPNSIRDAITENDDGTFTVRFYDRFTRQPTFVTVDREFYGTAEDPVYAHSKSGELWPAVMEKAYAQWLGSYQATERGRFGGHPAWVVRAITNENSKTYSAQQDGLFEKIQKALDEKGPVTATSPGASRKEKEKGIGTSEDNIVYWHLYPIFNLEEADGSKYVVLRNPNGKEEFTPPKPEGVSAEEHQAELKRLHFGASDDGYFRIPWDEFVENFSDVTISQPDDDASSEN